MSVRYSYWPTEEGAQKQAAYLESCQPGGTYEIKRTPSGWRLMVDEPAANAAELFETGKAALSEPKSGPELLYNLELDAEELSALYQILQIVDKMVGLLTGPESQIQEKVIRLMEGR